MDRLSVAHSLAMLVQTSDPYVAVRAKDRFGQVLGVSAPVKLSESKRRLPSSRRSVVSGPELHLSPLCTYFRGKCISQKLIYLGSLSTPPIEQRRYNQPDNLD